MKLVRLKILEEFRSLQVGFEINFHAEKSSEEFEKFHPFCLAGLNGSGKSNILEVLASIFYHLECCVYDFPTYAFNKTMSSPNSYELEYYIADSINLNDLDKIINVKVKKLFGESPKMSIDDNSYFEISKDIGKSFMPDLVVAYSSGENETLSLPFVKMKLFQYDEYLKDFVGKNQYDKPKSSLLFIDYEMSQAVLLTALLFYDFETNNKQSVLWPLKEELGIRGIHQFTINLKNNWQKYVGAEDSQIQLQTLFTDDEYKAVKDKKSVQGRILDHIQDQVQKLSDCATCSFVTDDYSSLDFFVDESTKLLIRKKFDNDPYNFFSVFQMLQALNERVEEFTEKKEIYNSQGYYTDYKRPEYTWFFNFTDYFILKEDKITGVTNKLLLKQLSDGEQQFLHTLGICLMLKNKRTLLLLDEPETHFNPDWRSKFINILRKTLEAGGDNFLLKDIILTSHSPFIISDCLPDKVIQFRKTENGVIAENAETLNFKTFGAGVDYILQSFFGVKSLVSEYSLNKLKDIIENGSDEELLQAIDIFGESEAKQFLFKEISKRNNDDNN